MIPYKKRPEWADLIKKKINPDIRNLSLRLKIDSLHQNYKHREMTLEAAIDDLHEQCVKYEKSYADDLARIFEAKAVSLYK